MKKIINKNMALFLLILLFCFLIFGLYYKEHYVSDTYRFVQLGTKYFGELKLVEGRPIQSMYFFTMNKIGINISSLKDYLTVYRINLTISIILIAFIIFFTYNKIKKIININEIKNKLLFLIAISSIFINISVNEYLLYVENYIMILGILLTICASFVFIKYNNKLRYIISFLLLIIAGFCYQGTLTIFIPFSYFLILITKRKNNYKELLKSFVIYFLVIILNFIIIRYYYNVYPNYDYRIKESVKYIYDLFTVIKYCSMFLVALVGIYYFVILSIDINILRNFKIVINLLIIIFTSVISYSIFTFGNTACLASRLTLSLYSSFGIICMYISIYFKDINNKNTNNNKLYNKKRFTIIVIIYLLTNIFIGIYFQYKSINSTIFNQEIIYKIIDKINEYEKSSGKEIKNVAFYSDKQLNYNYYGQNNYIIAPYVCPILYSDCSDIYSINELSNRKFNKVSTKELNKELVKYFTSKNWDEFNIDEQIIFVDDTVNICNF